MTVSITECRDCMEAMREFPDGYFDLAVVDPPYGNAGGKCERTGGAWAERYGKKIKKWDTAPGDFKELFRVSKNQIVFGGNYFSLPPTRCFIVWRKPQISDTFTMAMAEYAWTSFGGNALVFEAYSNTISDRFHPSQKPISLYKWIFKHFAKPGNKILDTHLGSGSSRIAAYDAGLDFYGYEIDEEYFKAQEQRFYNHTAQFRIDFEGEK